MSWSAPMRASCRLGCKRIVTSSFRRKPKRRCDNSRPIEAAKLIGVNDGYLRRLSLEGKGPAVEVGPNGRRSYTIEDIQALRAYLDGNGKARRKYVPGAAREHLRSSRSSISRAAAARRRRPRIWPNIWRFGLPGLAIDLDPQASLSALHGIQPEFDIGDNETLYGAIRYSGERRALREIIRKTYFHESRSRARQSRIDGVRARDAEGPDGRQGRGRACSSPAWTRRCRRLRISTTSSSSIVRRSSAF